MATSVRNREREHRWALWRTHSIGFPLRTRILQTPWFGVYLHRHHRPDAERHLHDHPWPFLALVLRGGYTELWSPWCLGPRQRRTWRRFSVHRMRIAEFHSIRELHGTTWTLVLVGRRRCAWGFATPDGWVSAPVYFQRRDRAEVAS